MIFNRFLRRYCLDFSSKFSSEKARWRARRSAALWIIQFFFVGGFKLMRLCTPLKRLSDDSWAIPNVFWATPGSCGGLLGSCGASWTAPGSSWISWAILGKLRGVLGEPRSCLGVVLANDHNILVVEQSWDENHFQIVALYDIAQG